MSEIGQDSPRRVGSGRRIVTAGRVRVVLFLFLLFLLLYYPIGMLIVHAVDDDVDFAVPEADEIAGGSHTVDMMAALIDREVNRNRWTANDPFFLPAAALDNMPSFQQGIVGALARFTFELTDQLGRTRGSSQTDPDLQDASGKLQYSGTIWVWDLETSWTPTTSSEKQYENARRKLLSYNRRLAAGEAVFERRGDNLMATLDRIALDLGSSTAVLDRQIHEHAGDWIDFQSDDVFYNIKGQVYAYYLLLRELRRDFAKTIDEREIGTAWDQMLLSMRNAAVLDPLVVVNGDPAGLFLPNHLAVQGFYLLRARTQLREITNVLLK
ncbi:DUF2333 family protein [Oceanibacterium hippocampi]|uniref:DUF2333 domain-containing protein n=1 Tax=Oceanibacterium hippocampi TaxID=745714 RepID=A0A1Y5RM57_9PROT|nr:DUF2333 family protein [Oceanibacterium hippocampi]SLN19596.1 hypothetical protein OCH7691_00451 [Oceanibacterium hippocampi]